MNGHPDLHGSVADAESVLGSIRAAQLLEANEGLVLAALRARSDADTARQALGELSRSANLDALTGLPNRVLLLDRFMRAGASARRHGSRMALLFLDLDDFKQINDALGHAAGDRVLQRVAARLAGSVRDADTVSRYGGDEFVILLTEVSQASDALRIADKMIAALGAPSGTGDPTLLPSASIGVSIYPDDGEDAHTLISCADAAMYRAKRRRLGSVAFSGAQAAGGCRPERPGLELPQQGAAARERAPNDRGQAQLRDAREANTQLLLAALSAREMQSAAEQTQQRLTQIMAVVAHELRNPIAPIRTAAALLGRVRWDELPRLQAIIERQVVRVLSLINDLLDVSRVRTGKLRLDHERVRIDEVVAEALDACRPAIEGRSQHLRVDMPSGAIELEGDPTRLAQIVGNLLDNASKYTPAGGDIGLSAVAVGDDLVITVSDSGIGITADALPRIFELFEQEAHATGFNDAGLGIGLSVVRELVQAHDGSVAAHSAGVGRGSQFVVTLPIAGGGRLRQEEPASA